MKASRVHAVMAAGLENPALLTLWRQEPEALRHCGVEPDQLDLDALWKFAGLSAKVRHNGLRAELPLTFRFLNVAGLEIEVFATYAAFRAAAGGRYADSVEGRTQDLLHFLEGWLDLDRHEHALLWDLIRYETALTQLRQPATAVSALPATNSSSTRQVGGTSVPRVCGEIILHEMRSDPRAVGATLQEKSPRLDQVSLGEFHFCYWRQSAGIELHILQLDELGFYLLLLADGTRSAADLSRMMGGNSRPAKGLLNALSKLAGIGIIAFDKGREKAA